MRIMIYLAGGIMTVLVWWCVAVSLHTLRTRDLLNRLDTKLAEHFEKVHGDIYEKKGGEG